MNGNNSLFGGDDDSELFGPSPVMTGGGASTTTSNGGGSRAALMGSLVGDSAEAPATAAAAPTSKLSASGLIGGASAGLFGEDSGAVVGGDGGGSLGLFDQVDSDAAEKGQRERQLQEEQQRRRREAEAAIQLGQQQQHHHPQQQQQQQQQQQAPPHNNISLDGNVDMMHELNLNDNNGEFMGMGMGMGLGGEIPKGPPPEGASTAPQPSQYQQYPHQPPPGQQQPPQGPPPGVMNAMGGSYYYSTTGEGQMTGQPLQPPAPQPSVLAGMHVGHDPNLGGVAPSSQRPGAPVVSFAPMPGVSHAPVAPFDPLYGRIAVTDPMLISGGGLFAGPPHWTYLVTVHAKGGAAAPSPLSAVRRRFRHFVALEDRLRAAVPGAILPPRPDKHSARALEEATTSQSAEFARERAGELARYANALAAHPHAGPSPELKLFLTLQDHIGAAWPEVSPSAFTRMTAVATASVEKLADAADAALGDLVASQQGGAAGEDSAEVLALAAHEGRRIGAVAGAVPRVEGAVGLVRDRGERLGAAGLEAGKLAKDVAWCDRDLARPVEVLAGALLRSGRRTQRLGLELAAAARPFADQYRGCRYEQMAFADRRAALKRRAEARVRADNRAAKLVTNQYSMQSRGNLGALERMETEAAMYNEMATEADREAEEVAERLQSEVRRIAETRVREWDTSMKVIASGMKEACAENAAVWDGALEAFRRDFPECPGAGGMVSVTSGGGGGGGV